MTPKQLPSGSWRLRVYIGKDSTGKAMYKSITRNSKRECLRDALEIQGHHKEISRDASAMTLREAIDAYIADRTNILSPATIRGYRVIQRNRFQPEMDIKLCNMTRRKWQSAVNREARNLSAKTVINSWGLVNAILGEYDERIEGINLPQKKKYEAAYLNKSDIATLLQAIDGHKYELPILMCVALGIRRSELIALTWDDYNPARKTISINKALVQDEKDAWVEKATTKTYESTRTLTLPDRVCALLDAMDHSTARIYPYSPHNIYKHLTQICESCGLGHIRLHDLRHSNASLMLSLGVNNKVAMERGGWSSSQTMNKIYQHTFRTDAEEADKTMNAFFNDI